jgi:hypothetical protein
MKKCDTSPESQFSRPSLFVRFPRQQLTPENFNFKEVYMRIIAKETKVKVVNSYLIKLFNSSDKFLLTEIQHLFD